MESALQTDLNRLPSSRHGIRCACDRNRDDGDDGDARGLPRGDASVTPTPDQTPHRARRMGGGISKTAKAKKKLAAAHKLAALRVSEQAPPRKDGTATEPEPEQEPEAEPEPEPPEDASGSIISPVGPTVQSPERLAAALQTPPRVNPTAAALELGPPPEDERIAELTAYTDQAEAIQRAWRKRAERVALKAGATAMSVARRQQKLAAIFAHYDKDKTGRLTREHSASLFSEGNDDAPPTEEGWASLCGVLGVDPSDGISLEDLKRLYSPEVLGTTAAQHLDEALDRTYRALFPMHASPMRGSTAARGLAGKGRRSRKDKKRKKKKKNEGAPAHETTELQLRRMESELRKLAEQDPEDEDVQKLLEQTETALEALRGEVHAAQDANATNPPSDPSKGGDEWATLPHWAGEQALGARIAAQGAQLAVVQGADSANEADMTPAARIASLNTIAMEEMKIGQSASALARLQEAWELVQQVGTEGAPAEQSAHLRATTLHNLGLWAASFGGVPGAGQTASGVVPELFSEPQQGHASGLPSGRKKSTRPKSNGRNGRPKSNGRGRQGQRGPQLGMGRDVSRLPRVKHGPSFAHPSAIQSREESKVNVQEVGGSRRRPKSRPASAPAKRGQNTGVVSRPRPSSARPVGRAKPAPDSNKVWGRAGETVPTGSPSDWSAPTIEDRRLFAVEQKAQRLTKLGGMYGAGRGGSNGFRGNANVLSISEEGDYGVRSPLTAEKPESKAAWGSSSDGAASPGERPGTAPAQQGRPGTVPAQDRPGTAPAQDLPVTLEASEATNHDTTRRSTRSPLVSSSMSTIGSAESLSTSSPHDGWLSSAVAAPNVGSGEAQASRRLQMDAKPWRQTGRRRKVKTEDDGSPLPAETFLGGTLARMERNHKAQEKVDAFWSTKTRPHDSPTRNRQAGHHTRPDRRSLDLTGRIYTDPAHAAKAAQSRWTPGGAKDSPERFQRSGDVKRVQSLGASGVSMAVPRTLKPVGSINLAQNTPSSSPLRAMRAQHAAEADRLFRTPAGTPTKAEQADRENAEEATAAAVAEKQKDEAGDISFGDMDLEEAVRVTTRGCLTIAEVVRKSTAEATRRVAEIDPNTAHSQPSVVSVPAAEVKKRRSAVETSAQRMSAAAYILEKLVRTLDGEHLGANMVALREHANKVPRPISPSRSTMLVMVRSTLRLCRSSALLLCSSSALLLCSSSAVLFFVCSFACLLCSFVCSFACLLCSLVCSFACLLCSSSSARLLVCCALSSALLLCSLLLCTAKCS